MRPSAHAAQMPHVLGASSVACFDNQARDDTWTEKDHAMRKSIKRLVATVLELGLVGTADAARTGTNGNQANQRVQATRSSSRLPLVVGSSGRTI